MSATHDSGDLLHNNSSPDKPGSNENVQPWVTIATSHRAVFSSLIVYSAAANALWLQIPRLLNSLIVAATSKNSLRSAVELYREDQFVSSAKHGVWLPDTPQENLPPTFLMLQQTSYFRIQFFLIILDLLCIV